MARTIGSASAADSADQTDEDVVHQVLAGNTAIFELLMRRHNERLYRAARAIVRDEQEAEDVMQQAYVNAFSNLRQFNGSARFATWLTRIAINESLSRVRRQGRYETFDDEAVDLETMRCSPPHDPERQAFAGELRELLEWAIDGLPDGMREVFVLRDVEGLSTSEVALALSVSDDVVKTRLSRARAALRRLLEERTGATAHEVFRFHRSRCDRVVAAVLTRSPPSHEQHGSRLSRCPYPASRCHLSSSAHSVSGEVRPNAAPATKEGRSVMRRTTVWSILLVLSVILAIIGLGRPTTAQSPNRFGDRDDQGNEDRDDRRVQNGRAIFRFDTFRDEQLWTDVLRMHEVIETVDPTTALGVGLKVDVQALPPRLIAALRAGQVDLTDPAVTIELLRLDAVVGVRGRVNRTGRVVSLGITCALCHSSVDDSFAPGIGRRLDGWANTTLNVGAILALSPALDDALKAGSLLVGPWQIRSAAPRFRRNEPRHVEHAIVANRHSAHIRPERSRLRDGHGRRSDLLLERLRGGGTDGRPRQLPRSAHRSFHHPEARRRHAKTPGPARISTEPAHAGSTARQFQPRGGAARQSPLSESSRMRKVSPRPLFHRRVARPNAADAVSP